MTRLTMAVVGVGHLGKEHARILAALPEVELVGVADPDAGQAAAVAHRCGTAAYADHRPLIGRVHGAVIAAPTLYHHAVARDFLRAGVPLLVEKPLASNLSQADDLVRLAAEHGAFLQVGHIERFNPAFEELISRGVRPRYVSGERCGGFTGRSTDVGVVLDLMIHDLDLVLSLTRCPVVRVEAMGVVVLGGHEDVAQARVTFADGCVADLHASRVHPEASRRMRLWTTDGFAAVDFARRQVSFTRPADHLRGVDSRRLDAATRASLKDELFSRHLPTSEVDVSKKHTADQLTRELQEFVACVSGGGTPRVDGAAGRDALALAGQILEQIHGQTAEVRRAA